MRNSGLAEGEAPGIFVILRAMKVQLLAPALVLVLVAGGAVLLETTLEPAEATMAPPPMTVRAAEQTANAVPMDAIRRLLNLVATNSATPSHDEALFGAVSGMLRTLDPHSRFFTPAEFLQLQDQQSGTYSGLGITVTSRFGRLTVVSPPFPGAPAEKAGLRVGDVITHVDGEEIRDVDLDTAVGMLKGPRGTAVEIRVARPGLDDTLDIHIVRDEISSFTVSNAFRIEGSIGYVKVESFSGTTSSELEDAIERLDPDTLGGLILDLRDNPGGLMGQAIAVSEIFLDRGKRVLETRGRSPDAVQFYNARRSNRGHEYPLVVLINRQSASASEIVSGAIQDHDRGLVVGQTSFGKGLVQSVFPLDDGAGIALTTQKWLTPSGRLIQRDYSEISDFDYYNGTAETPEPTDDDVFYSDLGRIVYGGGGITPDILVPAREFDPVEDRLLTTFAFYTFTQELAGEAADPETFEVTDALLDRFVAHLEDRGIDVDAGDVAAHGDFVRSRILYELFYNRLGVTEAARVELTEDPQVRRAIEVMPEAADLAARAQRAESAASVDGASDREVER
jgi:carboxyl-terminal processing protease